MQRHQNGSNSLAINIFRFSVNEYLEVEPPGQEASPGHNTDDRVEAHGVIRHNVQQLATARLLAIS